MHRRSKYIHKIHVSTKVDNTRDWWLDKDKQHIYQLDVDYISTINLYEQLSTYRYQ